MSPKATILIVDDAPDNLKIAAELLQRIGFHTREANSGEAALESHAAVRSDLILMDLRMPGIGGVEAIRRLRERDAQVPLIAFTASGFDDLQQEARAAGANDVLYKPYRESALLETIARFLDVQFIYEGEAALGFEADARPARQSLTQLLMALPAPLQGKLRDAALQARPARIEAVSDEIARYSPAAAEAVRALVRDFRYGEITNAIAAPSNANPGELKAST